MEPCPFCHPRLDQLVSETLACRILRDGFPISPGHTLVVPKRHVASIFDLPFEECMEIWSVVSEVRKQLRDDLQPDGFNIGVNDGTAAGQTVPHAHIHVIPRFNGDVLDPRGGVRWVIPQKADYWNPEK